APEAIHIPGHDNIELPFRSVTVQRVEGRPLVAPLGTADAVVLVDLDDLPPGAIGGQAQLVLLVRGVLIGGRDPQVDGSALHGWPPDDARRVTRSVWLYNSYSIRR